MSDKKDTRVLITGANGFVGSRLCRRLIDDGYQVYAGIREGCDGTLIEGLDMKIRFGDVTHPEELPEMIKDIDVIIHNAGLVKVKKIEDFYLVNEQGTENIIKAAVESGTAKKFILISSMAAAGISPRGIPRTEEMPPIPVTNYGRSKLAGEKKALEYKDKIELVILRPSGIYGPGDKEMFSFFQTLNNRIKPYLGSPSRRLQLLHVDDLALAVSTAITKTVRSGSIYFIAEKNSHSYAELVGYLRKAVGRVALPIYIPGFSLKVIAWITESFLKLFGKVPMLTVDKTKELLGNFEVSIEKAETELGFEPEYDFPTGAVQTVHWYRLEGWL